MREVRGGEAVADVCARSSGRCERGAVPHVFEVARGLMVSRPSGTKDASVRRRASPAKVFDVGGSLESPRPSCLNDLRE